jgi:vacuolar-type H+-ATPase subunit E/Vma4
METNQDTADALCREIRDRSEADSRAAVEAAGAEAARIVDAARAEAEKFRAETEKKSHAQAEALKKRILSGVRLEVQKQRLQVTEETLTRILGLVKERLEAFRKDKAYGAFLDRMVLEGVRALDSDEVKAVAGDVERSLLTQERLSGLEKEAAKSGRACRILLSPETLGEGGVVLHSADGRTRFDNGFSARIRRYENDMRMKAMKLLEK